MTKAQQLGVTEFPYREFDGDGNRTYYETSDGWWSKSEYDGNGNRTCFENSDGYWWKCEYDANGTRTYLEDSEGVMIDNRNK